jgi:hypothetical protein
MRLNGFYGIQIGCDVIYDITNDKVRQGPPVNMGLFYITLYRHARPFYVARRKVKLSKTRSLF